MTTRAEELEALAGAIDHASRSLAIARASLHPIESATPPGVPGPAEKRVRAEVSRVARLLEEASEPGRVPPAALEGAAGVLDRELGLFAGGGAR